MKRFYKQVSVSPTDGGFAILLDGRPVKTPTGTAVILPTARLAHAIAMEWQAQGEEVVITSMPLVRLANTVIDGVRSNRNEVIEAILRFGESDLLCYRAHQPPQLVARQHEGWDPILDWVRQRHGANLRVTHGMTHVDQPPDALLALRQALEEQGPFALGPMHVIASITGSAVLALAVAHGFISGEYAFAVSRIDENYQSEKWGEDAEAAKRASHLAFELEKAEELMYAAR